jgi:hypothetical protein
LYAPLSDSQAKAMVDSLQTYSALADVRQKLRSYSGGMHWKSAAGREYLYRTHDGKGNASSLGLRSGVTEQTMADFVEKKRALQTRQTSLQHKMLERSRMAKALRIGTAPKLLASLCEKLVQADLMGKHILIIGTNALYAYEALAGVQFDSDIIATSDIDLLWQHRTRITAVTRDVQEEGLLGILQKIDKTFSLLESEKFRAVNDAGFMVDFIRQTPSPPWRIERQQLGGVDDFVPVDLPNMKWMISAPRLRQVVLAQDGRAFEMEVPDPRAFMLYKNWLCTQPEREPLKRGRHASQAQLIASLLQERLPQYPLEWSQLRSFPKQVRLAMRPNLGAGD